MIKRRLQKKLIELTNKFPIVTLIGPRQSGKTTLAKMTFHNYQYVSLEDIDMRLLAIEDPRGFLQKYSKNCIIDEIQNAPELLSYIQTKVDRDNIKGQYVLTGSQNLLISEKISQSLAGRTAVLKLLPFSQSELETFYQKDVSYEEVLKKGFYPRLFKENIAPNDFYMAYFETYVQRDVRQIQNIRNLNLFTSFVKLCAGRTGQILDLSSLATDAGISVNTVKEWISILEASYIIFLLQPYFKNYNKRLIKSPKLYFYDTGLLSFLLNIETSDQLTTHYLRGSIFENYVILEMIKNRLNQGLMPNLYYWRDNKKAEIDCVIDETEPIAIEIKSGKTFSKDYLKMSNYWNRTTKNEKFYLVYGGDESFAFQKNEVISWRDIADRF